MTLPAAPAVSDRASVLAGSGIEELLGIARCHIPGDLLDGSGWDLLLDRVRDLSGHAVASNLAGFEFRLGDDEPSADFGIMVSGSTPLADYYSKRGRVAPAGSREAALGDFMFRLNSDSWPSSSTLEYDIVGVPNGERPDPGLFLNVGPLPQNAGVPPPGEVVGILADALCLPRDDGEREAVERVYETLPPDAHLYTVGAMPCRALRAVRLTVESVHERDIPGFLRGIGWAGPVQLAKDTLADMIAVAPQFCISLDVAPDGPLPHIGLGLSPCTGGLSIFDSWLNSTRSDWQPLIEHLTDKGLCLQRKGEALLAWPGLDRLVSRLGMIIVYRGIVWVKIVVSGSGVQAKAYTGLTLNLI